MPIPRASYSTLIEPAVVTGGTFSADGQKLAAKFASGGSIANFQVASVAAKPKSFRRRQFRAEPPKRRYEVSAPIKSGVSQKACQNCSGPADSKLPLVVIDAGHGGHDPGAISPHGGKREKDVTLAIARPMRSELLKTGRVRVALTRDTDKFLVLQDRYEIARKMNADLFISIHADSAENPEANGGTVYTPCPKLRPTAKRSGSHRERTSRISSTASILAGADANVSSILIDLTQRETMNVSADFAKLLLREAQAQYAVALELAPFCVFHCAEGARYTVGAF